MKYLLGLILLISVSASAQYSPTAAKTRFVNGIGLGTKDTATMNAADTVAMIVGRDSLVYFRYKGYWKPLAYNSSLTGYVPYTGATSSVNLGSYNLTANKIAIGGSISAVALDVHRAGSIVARIENTNSSQDALFAYAQSAQNVWFTGIDYASGANNFGFYYTPDGTTVIRKAYFSNSGDLTANSFIKSGGTSSQFLKADGSVTTIIPSGSIDTGRAATAIATGGSLNKVRDSLQANIGLKLNISDTATMLSSYYNKTATDSRLALKVNYTDTASMLSSYYNKTATDSKLALKVNISDTSTMLSPYQRAYNAVKYTDTATMLSGYKTYYPRAALSAGTGITYNASTGVITNSSPSTGGTVTSVATNTGSGITGGTITSSGTIAADTSVLSTKANVTASLLSKVSSVSATSPIASSGGLTPTISISQSSGSTNGYLSSTDWNTFNNKGSGSVTSIATDATMTGGTITTSGTLKVDTSIMATRLRVQKGIDSLGAAKQGNITLTTTGTSGAATFSSNTLNIPQYQSAGTYVTSVTGTSPIVSSGGTTPAISIPAATTSVNGYLTSTDWNTFNGKQDAITNPVTGSGTTNYLPKFTGTSTIGNSNLINDASGNLGLGVTPSAWNGIYKVAEIGTAAIFGSSSYNSAAFSTNVFYNSGNSPRYIANDFSNMYWQDDGQHIWYNAPSGTAGNAITFTQAMTLDASGNLIVGDASTSQSAKVYISRTSGSTDFATNSTLFLNSQNESTTANLIRFNGALSKGLVFGRGINVDNFVWGFTNSTTPVMTLTASGRLLIGTPTEASYMLDVNGTGRFSGALTISGPSPLKFKYSDNYDYYGIGYISGADYGFYNYNYGRTDLIFTQSTGAATFSSSVTASGITSTGTNTMLSASSSTAGLIVRGGSSIGTASLASGQILVGQTTTYRLSLAYDDNTGYAYIDNLYDNANSNIYFRVRTNGTPINALTLFGSGAATFSSTLGINGTADNVKSGTYTPTSQDYTNITSATNYTAQYMRVGNVVTVSGKISTTSTAAATLSYFSLSLPITSSFTTEQQAAGHGTLKNLQTSDKDAVIYAGTGSNKVQFSYYTAVAGASDIFYHFTYLIN